MIELLNDSISWARFVIKWRAIWFQLLIGGHLNDSIIFMHCTALLSVHLGLLMNVLHELIIYDQPLYFTILMLHQISMHYRSAFQWCDRIFSNEAPQGGVNHPKEGRWCAWFILDSWTRYSCITWVWVFAYAIGGGLIHRAIW